MGNRGCRSVNGGSTGDYVQILLNLCSFHLQQTALRPNLNNLNQKLVPIKRRLKSRNTEYNFKWNHQPCLSRVSNLRRGSNSLNSASGVLKIFSRLVSSTLTVMQVEEERGFFGELSGNLYSI